MNPSDIDIVLRADPKTVRVVPWAAEATAQVIHDCFYGDGRPVTMAPRYVLRRGFELFEADGLEPGGARQLQLFPVGPKGRFHYSLHPPVVRPGPPALRHRGFSSPAGPQVG